MAKDTKAREIKTMSFEDALEELKEIVATLESGEGKLDEAISAYQRGADLKRHCETKLRQAVEKIEKISLGPDGKVHTTPLDAE